MEIIQIKPSSPYAGSIKEWVWREWGKENNRPYMEKLIDSTLGGKLVPSTWGCVINGHLAGSVSLFVIDLVCRQDLSPWVACLYVHPDYRRRGIGMALLRQAEDVAAKAGFNIVYLYTQIEGFYEKSGWRFEGLEMNYGGSDVRLYSKEVK